MNEEDKIAWIDEENKFHAIEECIKQTHTYVKCKYKQSGFPCRILEAVSKKRSTAKIMTKRNKAVLIVIPLMFLAGVAMKQRKAHCTWRSKRRTGQPFTAVTGKKPLAHLESSAEDHDSREYSLRSRVSERCKAGPGTHAWRRDWSNRGIGKTHRHFARI